MDTQYTRAHVYFYYYYLLVFFLSVMGGDMLVQWLGKPPASLKVWGSIYAALLKYSRTSITWPSIIQIFNYLT